MKTSFRFVDNRLNTQLIAILQKSSVQHKVSKEGFIYYDIADEETIENELIAKVRNKAFSSWQILSCPDTSVDQYRIYMSKNKIRFIEELIDGETNFLLNRRYRPNLWKLDNQKSRAKKTVAAH